MSENATVDLPLFATALSCAHRGWPVFPCRPGTKVPATRNGFKDATTDPDRVSAFWEKFPTANVAIATGAPGPDVVDVDCKRGAPGYENLNRLVRAGLVTGAGALVRTPSGGLHLYFVGSEQRSSTLPAHGIDFRSLGGYVVAPPSLVNGARYGVEDRRQFEAGVNWQAIRDFLQPPKPVQPYTGPTSNNLDGLARWVAGIQEGNRDQGLFWACCRAIEGGHSDLSALVQAGLSTGLTEREVRKTVASAIRRNGGRS